MVVRRLWPDSPDVVLSGHTHTIAYSRHENSFGGFSEFTGNSVWKAPEIETAEPICADLQIGIALRRFSFAGA